MKQLFVNIVGHNSSGKTTLAKMLETDLACSRISGDDFREFVHEKVAYFRNTDVSYPNQRFNELNPLVLQYRFGLNMILLRAGQNVLFDGSGATKEFRARYLTKIKADFPEVTRVIISVELPEQELRARLEERGKGWLKQYDELKKHSFEPPEDIEAEKVLHYDQQNYDEIKANLRELLA